MLASADWRARFEPVGEAAPTSMASADSGPARFELLGKAAPTSEGASRNVPASARSPSITTEYKVDPFLAGALSLCFGEAQTAPQRC